jgi:protein-tyrosine phosphatase
VTRSEIVPGLFVGSRPLFGRHPDVDVIVLAAEEYQPPAELFPGVEVLHTPLDDDPRRPLRPDEILAATTAGSRVARRLRAGRRVLCTCRMGLNRSALIAALALHEIYGMSADKIVARIRQARGAWALSNPNFEKMLRVVIDVRSANRSGRGVSIV